MQSFSVLTANSHFEKNSPLRGLRCWVQVFFWAPNNDWRPLKNDGLLEYLWNGAHCWERAHIKAFVHRQRQHTVKLKFRLVKNSVRHNINAALRRISLAPSSIKPTALNPFPLSSSRAVPPSRSLLIGAERDSISAADEQKVFFTRMELKQKQKDEGNEIKAISPLLWVIFLGQILKILQII